MSDHNHGHGNGHDHHSDGHKDAHGHNHEPSLGYLVVVILILGSLFLWTRSWPNDGPAVAGVFIAAAFFVLVLAPFLDKGDHGHH